MKVIVAGPRSCYDYELVVKAIEESGFEITELISGKAKGVDNLGERWAKRNNIPIKEFPAKWDDLEVEGALVKEGKFGKYNARACFDKNQLMCEYSDALIMIDNNNSENNDMIERATTEKLQIFIYNVDNTGYIF